MLQAANEFLSREVFLKNHSAILKDLPQPHSVARCACAWRAMTVGHVERQLDLATIIVAELAHAARGRIYSYTQAGHAYRTPASG